ncbi:MAG: O-antigen ligase family protein [Coriobacteriia bacterium]|nr:O-antigen ligase family protein [Coriobacteriia bacterium]
MTVPQIVAACAVAWLAVVVPLVPDASSVTVSGIDVVMLAVAVALIAAVPLVRRTARDALPGVGMTVAGAGFIAWAALGILFSVSPVGSLMTLGRYGSYLLLVAAVAVVAVDPRLRRTVMGVISAAATVTALHGLWQYSHPTVRIGMQEIASDVSARVFASFSNPNFYAEYLVMTIAVTAALAMTSRRALRILWITMCSIQVAALLLTYTRGSWLALVVGLVVAGSMIDPRIAVLPVMLIGVMAPLIPGVVQRLSSMFTLSGSAGFRIKLWRVALAAIASRPVFGYGLGRFYEAFLDVIDRTPGLAFGYAYYGAHNSYLQIAAETGVVGGVAFAALVATACRVGLYYNPRLKDRSERWENALLTAGMIAFAINALTSNAFQHPQGAVFFFVLAGLQAGLGSRVWDEPPAVPSAPKRQLPSVVQGSAAVRAVLRAQELAARAWRGSLARRLLVQSPATDGKALWRSVLKRAVDGPWDRG